MSQAVLGLRGIHHGFGPKLVLHDVNLEIGRGQICSLVGPSGCGKSTLLRAILGTHPARQGEVVAYHGTDTGTVVSTPGRDRGIVYQRYALFPFLTAQQNVAVGPTLDETTLPQRILRYGGYGATRKRHLDEAAALLEKVGLGDALGRYPHELSGGMRQRVAIAQALIMKPEILLLDEPFGALDEATREDLQLLLLGLYKENLAAVQGGALAPYTILIVTHELNEAIYVGDRVIGLSQYWDWEAAGCPEAPGATVTYDKVARVYHPGEEKRYEEFIAQREEIRSIVFEPATPVDPSEHVLFWGQVERGEAHGVLGTAST